jgi:hypothetical protein
MKTIISNVKADILKKKLRIRLSHFVQAKVFSEAKSLLNLSLSLNFSIHLTFGF